MEFQWEKKNARVVSKIHFFWFRNLSEESSVLKKFPMDAVE
jgi:hypothetical protein